MTSWRGSALGRTDHPRHNKPPRKNRDEQFATLASNRFFGSSAAPADVKKDLSLSALPLGDSSDCHSGRFVSPSAPALPTGVRTALHQLALPGLPWCEQLAVARYQHWQRMGLLRKTLWKYGVTAVVRSLQAHQVGVSSLCWAGGFTGSAHFSYREAVEDGCSAIAEAAAVGAETLIIAPGSRSGHTVRHARRTVLAGLQELASCAQAYQVRLAVLVAPSPPRASWSLLHRLEDAQELLEDLDWPWVGLACPLPRSLPACESWRALASRIWILWSQVDDGVGLLTDQVAAWNHTLQQLTDYGFAGVWEMHALAPNQCMAPREGKARCRALSEALGLPQLHQPGSMVI